MNFKLLISIIDGSVYTYKLSKNVNVGYVSISSVISLILENKNTQM